MRSFFTCALLFFSFSIASAQTSLNTTLIGSWTEGSVEWNDCWGYVDPSGNEYALIGSLTKFYVVNITNTPTSPPVKVGEVPGAATGTSSSIWRDMKTYGTYMYGVADQNGTKEGLTVINLAGLPSSISLVSRDTTDFHRAHNIYIDVPNARLYVLGSSGRPNSAPGGFIVYSLANPAAPVRIRTANNLPGGYIHDAFVKDNIVYASSGGNGLYIYNAVDVNNIFEIGHLDGYIDDGYNHSGWLSSDGTRYVFADETHGSRMKIADITDPANPQMNSTNLFQACLIAGNTGCIPHNPFIKGNLCFISYYHDGLQVFNISNPNSVTRVAYYDSYPGNTNYSGYEGAWGTYPYLPSGKIVISDITYGLRVVQLSGALPVDLVGFRGKYANKQITLNWETETEFDNKQFEIERSQTGREWTRIGVVMGHGNTSDFHAYRFVDQNPFEGDNYYRLRQSDFNNNNDVSEAIHVKVSETQTGIRVYPNLLEAEHTEVNIELAPADAPIQVSIADMQGKILQTNIFEPQNSPIQTTLSVKNLPRGMFILIADIDGQRYTQKIVK